MLLMRLALFYSLAIGTITCKVISEEFVFPLENTDEYCTFQNRSTGRCVNVRQCPIVNDEFRFGKNPTICHFEKNEPIVCCIAQIPQGLGPVYIKVNETKNAFFEAWKKNQSITGNNSESQTETSSSKPIQLNLANPLSLRRNSVASCESVYSRPAPFADDLFRTTIVGGQKTVEGEFPHMAALGWTNDGKVSWRCGGSLISHDYILTAAHCVIGRTPPNIIRIGEKDLQNVDTLISPQDFGIELIIGHPEYQPNQLYNDIALMKLNESVTITKKVRPACLWQTNAINFTDAFATGYGHTEFGGPSSNELLKVDLKIFHNDECAEVYKSDNSMKNGIIDSQICAGDSTGEKDTCQGDSGGPIQVFTKDDDHIVYHVIGVTSFGQSCASTLPGVYTRVSHYLEWIEKIVWK